MGTQPGALPQRTTADQLFARKLLEGTAYETVRILVTDLAAQLVASGAISDAFEDINDTISGGAAYQGTWNASTNTPAIPAAASGNRGWFYVVATAGSTNINGITTWGVADIIQSNGSAWQRIPVSDSLAATLALKAPLASPALTGTPTAPTAAAATDTTQIATTAFVHDVVAAALAAVTGADGPFKIDVFDRFSLPDPDAYPNSLIYVPDAEDGPTTALSVDGQWYPMVLGPVIQPLWSPMTLSPEFWGDPSDASTVFADTAGTIPATLGGTWQRINDKSGNGHHLTLLTGSAGVWSKTGDLYKCTIPSGSAYVSAANVTLTAPCLMAMAFAKHASGTGTLFGLVKNTTAYLRLQNSGNSNMSMSVRGPSQGNVVNNSLANTVPVTTPTVVSALHGQGRSDIMINGVSVYPSPRVEASNTWTGAQSESGYAVGLCAATPTTASGEGMDFYGGYIAKTDPDVLRSYVENYEGSKAGLTIPVREAVQFLWTGDVTSGGITVSVRSDVDCDVRLVISTNADLSSPVYSSVVSTTDRIAKLSKTGLTANTQYYYGVEADGVLQSLTGKFKTLPSAGAFSFRFTTSSCAVSASNQLVFDRIRERANNLFFIHSGDLHYQNTNTAVEALYHYDYDQVFAQSRQHHLYRDIPMLFMWDDHDFLGNGSHGGMNSTWVQAVRRAYRKRVPSPPLVEPGDTDAPYFSKVVARVRFIVTDLRSRRTASTAVDDATKTMMGSAQKTWFEAELLAAETAGQVVFWVSSVPWNGIQQPPSSGYDQWVTFHTERVELANFIKNEGLVSRMFIIAGDRHANEVFPASPADSSNDFATGGGSAMPAITASPLDQLNGPTVLTEYFYVDVTDTGGPTISVACTGIIVDIVTGVETVNRTLNFTLTP